MIKFSLEDNALCTRVRLFEYTVWNCLKNVTGAHVIDWDCVGPLLPNHF